MLQRPGPTACRWSAIFLCVILLFPCARLSAQTEQKYSLHLVRQPLTTTFKQLENLTGVSFAYDDRRLQSIMSEGADFKDATLTAMLEKLLKGSGYTFKLIHNNVVIAPVVTPPPAAPLPRPKGSVKGRVVDFGTSQPLAGATVRLELTGTNNASNSNSANRGNNEIAFDRSLLSDEKGYYVFNGVPDGVYYLTVSYSGYQKELDPGVNVKNGEELVMDIKLQPGRSLNEVVISSGGRKVKSVAYSTDKELLAEIREAPGVISGISNEMITKTGDRNAAEVVKRISGVTVVDERFIVIRGMNERYNLTYLNDNIAASTELYSRAFAYDLLPSSIIDKILVYKSPVADLVADYGGGAIKVFTKNAMPVRHLDIGIQLAHRPGSTMTRVNSYNGGKYDFIGFDDGTRRLPSFSPGYFHTESSANNISQATMLKAFSNTLNYGTVESIPDMQFFLNYYDYFKLGRRSRLYDLSSVTYTHETKSYDVYRQTGNTDAYGADPVVGLNYGNLNKIMNSQQSTIIGKVNVLENLTLKLGASNRIEWKNFFVNEGRSFTGINDSRLNALPRYDSSSNLQRYRDILLSFQQRLLYSGNLGGGHEWGMTHRQELDWNLGYTYDLQNVPDQRVSHFLSTGNGPYIATGTNLGGDAAFLGMISRLFVKNEENIYNVSADYTFHVSRSGFLKAGAYQMYKVRNVGRRFFRVNRGGLAPDEVPNPDDPAGNQGGYGLSNPNIIQFTQQQLGSIWNPVYFPDDNTGLKLYDATSTVDSYVASEQNNSFYALGDWKSPHEKFTVNAGLRVEYDRQKVASAVAGASTGSIFLEYGDHKLTSWLPSINLGYRPDSLYVLRAGYGRTVNRPEFRELSAYRDFDFQNNEVISGDPSIVSATIDNYDVRAEFYPRSARQNEVFNAGVFYKFIRNPIERFRYENTESTGNSNFTSITYGNSESAKLFGLEAEIRKSLSFVAPGRVFRDLSVVLNGAWIESSTRQVEQSGYTRDTLKGRPLQGQSPYVFNAGIFYENISWGTKVGVTYNVNGPRIYAKSRVNKLSSILPGQDTLQARPDLLQLPFQQLDLSVSQRIVRSLQLKFTFQNMLNQAYRIVEDHNYNQRYDPERPVINKATGEQYYTGDNIYNRYRPGQYLLVQFTYAF